MKQPIFEKGIYAGISYQLTYNRMCDVGGWQAKCWRWFLKINGDLAGDFKTKGEAMGYLTEISPNRIAEYADTYEDVTDESLLSE